MKNRRNVVIAFLLLAVLCLGIGFAALTDDLFVDGSFAFKDVDTPFTSSEIMFTKAEVTSDSAYVTTSKIKTNITVDSNNDTDDLLQITVEEGAFTAKDQTAVIKATIKNNTDYTITVALDSTTTSPADVSSVFEVTIDVPADQVLSQGEQVVTITIKVKAATNLAATTMSNLFKLKATAVEYAPVTPTPGE